MKKVLSLFLAAAIVLSFIPALPVLPTTFGMPEPSEEPSPSPTDFEDDAYHQSSLCGTCGADFGIQEISQPLPRARNAQPYSDSLNDYILVSEHFTFHESLQGYLFANISPANFNKFMLRMDTGYKAMLDLVGYEPHGDDKIIIANMMECPSGAYNHGGQHAHGAPELRICWSQGGIVNTLTNHIERVNADSWTFGATMHELGHIFDPADAPWDCDEQSSASFKAYYLIEKFGGKDFGGRDYARSPMDALAQGLEDHGDSFKPFVHPLFVNDPDNFFDWDEDSLEFGWKVMRDMLHSYKTFNGYYKTYLSNNFERRYIDFIERIAYFSGQSDVETYLEKYVDVEYREDFYKIKNDIEVKTGYYRDYFILKPQNPKVGDELTIDVSNWPSAENAQLRLQIKDKNGQWDNYAYFPNVTLEEGMNLNVPTGYILTEDDIDSIFQAALDTELDDRTRTELFNQTNKVVEAEATNTPSLELTVPEDTSPERLTLSATLSGLDNNSGKEIIFTVNGTKYTANTDADGVAICEVESFDDSSQTFGALFVGDANNEGATAPYDTREKTFTKTIGEVDIEFMVTSESEKTLQIGDGRNPAFGNISSGDLRLAGLRFVEDEEGAEYEITGIGHRAFASCTELTSVTLLDNITYIGSYAFVNCSQLESVTLPNGVKDIGEGVFSNCPSLTDIAIPNKVERIGRYAFKDCTALTDVTIPASVKGSTDIWGREIDGIDNEGPFSGCTSLENISVAPDNPDYSDIDGVLFYKESQREGPKVERRLVQYPLGRPNTAYTIPDSVRTIGNEAFRNCAILTSVTIDSVTGIDNGAFSGSSLKSVTIPNNVGGIGEKVFKNCTDLESVTIPSSVGGIGMEAFRGCTSLTKVVIPDKVKEIGDLAFKNCASLIDVTLGENTEDIADRAFFNCPIENLTIGKSLKSINQRAFSGWEIKKLTINNNTLLTTFLGMETLEELIIGDSVTSITRSAFLSAPWYGKQPDGLVYAGNWCIGYKGVMPDNTSLDLPANTIGIADTAFRAQNLASVDIPEGLMHIGSSAFRFCSVPDSVTIPSSVKTIGDYAFAGCQRLVEVTNLSSSPQSIGNTVFANIGEGATLHVPFEAQQAYEKAAGWSAFGKDNIIERDPQVGNTFTVPIIKALDGNNLNATLKITGLNPLKVQIGDGQKAAISFTSPGKLNIPETITYIRQNDGKEFTFIVERIGDKAFISCMNLTSITIPATVTSIGDQAFVYCTSLESMTNLAVPPQSILGEKGDLGVFYGTTRNTLYVPFGTIGAYTEDDYKELGWTGFTIIEFADTFTAQMSGNNITVRVTSRFGNTGTVSITSNNTASGTLNIPAFIRHQGITYIVTTIERNAFINSDLTSVTIPPTVTNIEEYAFRSSSKLRTVTMLTTELPSFGSRIFQYIHPNATLHVPYGMAEYYKQFWMQSHPEAPNKGPVTELDTFPALMGENYVMVRPLKPLANKTAEIDGALPGQTYDKVDILPNVMHQDKTYTITQIGAGAFFGNNELTSVTLPPTVTYIRGYAFRNCPNLKSVTALSVPAPICAEYVFWGNSGNTALSVPIGNKDAYWHWARQKMENERNLFKGSTINELKTFPVLMGNQYVTVTIGTSKDPNYTGTMQLDSADIDGELIIPAVHAPYDPNISEFTVESIGSNAFRNRDLTSVTIPDTVKKIGANAFSNTPLKSVTSYSTDPPDISGIGVFDSIHPNATLYVPAGTKEIYENRGWTGFNIISPSMVAVTLSNNQVTGVSYSQPVMEGFPVLLRSAAPINSTQVFLGWSDDSNATSPTYRAGDIFTVDSNITLYAVWGEKEDAVLPALTKLGAFGAGFLTNVYENPQKWTTALPFLVPDAELTSDTSGKKDLLELVDNSYFMGVQELAVDNNTWKNYSQLPGSAFMDNFNGTYVSGVVNDLKNNDALTNAATSGDVTVITNPTGAEDAQKLKIIGGNCTLNGDYPDLTEVRIESNGAAQLLGNYPNLEYIHITSHANLNLAGYFPALQGVYMPGGQLLLGTADLGFTTYGADIINENGDITIYSAQDTQIFDSNVVTNGKIAIRGAERQLTVSKFNADSSFFGAGNAITLGDLRDNNTEKFEQIPVYFSQSGISIVNCNMELLQGVFTTRDGTMILSGSDIGVFRGYLFAQHGIDGEQTLAKEGVYVEGKAFNGSTGLDNEAYRPDGSVLGRIHALMYAPMPEKFSMIENGTAFLDALTLGAVTSTPTPSPAPTPTPKPAPVIHDIWSGSLNYSINGSHYEYGGGAWGSTGGTNHRYMGFDLTNPSISYKTLTLEFANAIGASLPDGDKTLIRLHDFNLLDANGNQLPENLNGVTQTVYIDLHQYSGLNIANNNLAHFHKNGNLGPNGQGTVTKIFLTNVLSGTGGGVTPMPTPMPTPTPVVQNIWTGNLNYSVNGNGYEYGGGASGSTGGTNHRYIGLDMTNPSVTYKTLTLEFANAIGASLPDGNKALIRLYDFDLLDADGNKLSENLSGVSQTVYIDLQQYPGLNIANNNLAHFHKNGNLGPNGQGTVTRIFLVSDLP